jgi:hypothetical protein
MAFAWASSKEDGLIRPRWSLLTSSPGRLTFGALCARIYDDLVRLRDEPGWLNREHRQEPVNARGGPVRPPPVGDFVETLHKRDADMLG